MPEGTLKIAEKRREAESQGEKERYIQLNAEFQRKARGYKKANCTQVNISFFGLKILSFIET